MLQCKTPSPLTLQIGLPVVHEVRDIRNVALTRLDRIGDQPVVLGQAAGIGASPDANVWIRLIYLFVDKGGSKSGEPFLLTNPSFSLAEQERSLVFLCHCVAESWTIFSLFSLSLFSSRLFQSVPRETRTTPRIPLGHGRTRHGDARGRDDDDRDRKVAVGHLWLHQHGCVDLSSRMLRRQGLDVACARLTIVRSFLSLSPTTRPSPPTACPWSSSSSGCWAT